MNSVGVDCEIRTIQGFSLWSSDKDRSEMILRYELSRTLHGLCLWSWDKDRIKQILRLGNYRELSKFSVCGSGIKTEYGSSAAS